MKQQDKKEILGSFVYGFVIVIAILSIGWASQGKFGVLWSSLIQPLVQGTGSIGNGTNAWDAFYGDTVNIGSSRLVASGTTLLTNGALQTNGSITISSTNGMIINSAKSGMQGITKKGFAMASVDSANLYGWWADSSEIRTRLPADSRIKPHIHGFVAYASGTRPAAPALGDIICIDGTTTSDSLLVYLGGAWVVLKP